MGGVDRGMERAKIVARYADGRILKGYSYDFSPDEPRFHLVPAAAEHQDGAIEVLMQDLKAVFFVRDFAGSPQYCEQKQFVESQERRSGRKMEVAFGDGEVLVGYTMGYDPQRPGFFLVPADSKSNNLRVFAVSAAVSRIFSMANHRGANSDVSPPTGGENQLAARLISDVQSVVRVLRQTVAAWDGLVDSVQARVLDKHQLGTRREQLEQQHGVLRATHDRLRREHEELLGALAEEQSAYESLRREYEVTLQAVRELYEQYETLLRVRERAADELKAVLRRLHS